MLSSRLGVYVTHPHSILGVARTTVNMAKRKSGNVKSIKEDLTDKHFHEFTNLEEITELRQRLLGWYDENKRELPWREKVKLEDINERAYAVWVSEIMLQQTQVATVISYYNKWMKKWPTLQDLANATLEEVNEMWSGLGYYSRGRRLHEGAKKVVEELAGQMPNNADDLIKQLPGVGKYTAGAIASIAFNQVTGLVDGNVIRVFGRMRMIGADSTSQLVTDTLWRIANRVVDEERPGDFNQALMELGATVCSPKSPACVKCPVSTLCKAYAQVNQQKKENASKLGQKSETNGYSESTIDIECAAEACRLCLPDDEPWDTELGVTNYPRKGKKKAAREEKTAVCVLYRGQGDNSQYLIVQRPEKGLLAGLWEFPSSLLDVTASEKDCWSALTTHLNSNFGLLEDSVTKHKFVGEVVHIFSHIHQTYMVESATVDSDVDLNLSTSAQAAKWVNRQEFLDSAISTAMKKVFKAYENDNKTKQSKGVVKSKESKDGKKQLGLDAFFKPRSATK